MTIDTKNSTNVAIIGLGSMGYGMAASALRGGHKVWGVDINPDQIAKFKAEGGQDAPLSEVAETLDAIAVVVLNAAQTESVLFGEDGIVAKLKPGAVVLACATVPPSFVTKSWKRLDPVTSSPALRSDQ